MPRYGVILFFIFYGRLFYNEFYICPYRSFVLERFGLIF